MKLTEIPERAKKIAAVISAITVIGGAFTWAVTAINNHIDSRLAPVASQVTENRLSGARTELLLLIYHTPEDHKAILEASQRYFVTLKGDFYLGSVFLQWCHQENVEIPSWFNDY